MMDFNADVRRHVQQACTAAFHARYLARLVVGCFCIEVKRFLRGAGVAQEEKWVSWHTVPSAHHLIKVQHKHDGGRLARAHTLAHTCASSHTQEAAHHLIEVKREQKQDRSFKRPNDEHFRERAIWRHFVPVEEGVVRVRIGPLVLRCQNSGTDSK